MLKKIVFITALFLSVQSSFAQLARTRDYLDSLINNQITSNNNRQITGAQLRGILLEIVASFYNVQDDRVEGERILIEPGDFSGNNYTNSDLQFLTAELDFAVFANDGAGTKIRLNEGYGYSTSLGRLTFASGPGSYYITIFKPF